VAIVSDLVVSIEGLGRDSWLWVCGRGPKSLVGGEQQGCADLCERSAGEIFLNIIATYGRSLYALVCGLFISRWVLAALGEC